MAVYTEITLWLIPAEPYRAMLRSTIHRLAVSLEAVEFEPHVTIFCGASTESEARITARFIAAQFPPFDLIAGGLDHSGSFTKTLFVWFRESPLARRMFEITAARHIQPSNYVLVPHLSLAYKRESLANRKTLCETLEAPLPSYRFDRIRMIETELPIEDDGPVRRWKIVCDEPLLGVKP